MESNGIRSPKYDRKLTKDEVCKLVDISFVEFIKKMNWQIAMPTGGGPEDDGMIHGMIIGEEAYVDFILKHLD